MRLFTTSLLGLFLLIASTGYSQLFSLSDSSIIYRSAEGKPLSKEQVREIMKEKFSMRQEQVDGKKIVTLIPSSGNEISATQVRFDLFKAGLLNKPIPEFTLKDLGNKWWTSTDLKGKIIIINFWFTACKPCIIEMPHLNELVKDNTGKGVVFLAPAPESDAQVKKFLKKYSFDYNIIPSSLDYIHKVNVENFPTHLVIDKNGIIRQVLIGYAADIKDKLQKEIDKLLEE